MHLDFKDSVTRLTCFALDFMEEIKNPNADVDPEECRATCIELLRAFDKSGHEAERFQSARYALTAWIDDCLIRTRWPHAAMWNAHSLEQELYGTSCRNWKFFEQAEAAGKRGDWEALRVYQFCVAFGFRGIYGKDRMKVRLNDRLPMSRAPLESSTPILLGVLKEETSGVFRSQRKFGAGFSQDFSNTATAISETEHSPPGERWEQVLPPTLDEWSERTFSPLQGGPAKGLKRWLRFIEVLSHKEVLKDWALVMAVGFLLTAVLYAIGR
jgi:type IV/VI secretion system ImpK/VasF family protein